MSTSYILLITKDSNSSISIDFLTNLVRASVTKTKRKGDNGSPCLKPLLTTNSFVGLPLTTTDILLLKINNSIHFLHLSPNPILTKRYLRKFHDTLSYAF